MSGSEAHNYQKIALTLAKTVSSEERELRLRVDGNSMAPLVHPGDAFLVRPVQSHPLCRGDLIAIHRGAGVVTHRLVGVGEGGWKHPQGYYAKGDNSWQIDPFVPPQAVLGRVAAIERQGRRFPLQGGLWGIANRWLGWLSWWEGRVFGAGMQIFSHTRLAALAASPFRIPARVLLAGVLILSGKRLRYCN